MPTKTVVVTGDLLIDNHLVIHSTGAKGYSSPQTETLQYSQHGGAWFLGDMLELALSDLLTDRKCKLLQPERVGLSENAPIGKAHSIWSNFPQDNGAKNQVWRIADFLGCGAPADLANSTPVSLINQGKETRAGTKATIIVLDDIGLGFRAHKHLWPEHVLSKDMSSEGKMQPVEFVLKTNSFAKDNVLLGHLLEHHADRLTLVVAADDLRSRGAAISKGLSWDRTIEETVREFATGLSSCDLAKARRVVIHFEGGSGAASLTRLPLKLGPPRNPVNSPAGDTPVRDRVCFERFLYLPDEVEGVWSAERPGKMFGTASIMTAGIVRLLADPPSYPLFVAAGRALAAIRHNREYGGGNARNAQPHVDLAGLKSRLHWSTPVEDGESPEMTRKQWEQVVNHEGSLPAQDPCAEYYAAFPHEVLTDVQWRQQPASESNLLRDAVGPSLEYYAAVASDVVIRGPEMGLLRSVPKARYGKYMTVDREEIERINAIRGLIQTYRKSPVDKRPLSIAVFGPPGSGKSFAIKELAAAMFGKGQETLEFNLSQFADGGLSQLHEAFHRVRDASIKGAIPLVFWDEFDSDDLRWLKHFLAPTQDAEFRAGSETHPFGKAIFVFAGGTCAEFEQFDRSNAEDVAVQTFFRGRKGPDFVSRLRGFVNIKGPNPVHSEEPAADPEYLIRRAMILRSLLERFYGHLIDGRTRIANVSTRVVRALLQVQRFLHGARSLESVLSMSNLRSVNYFDVSELTTPDLLGLHVTADFMDIANRPEIEAEIIEALSKAFHEGWRKTRLEQGWTYAEKRNDKKRQHNLLVDFEQLSDRDKHKNYDPAIVTPAKLAQVGYRIRRRRATMTDAVPGAPWTGVELQSLLEIEHDVWVRSQMLQGFEYADNATDFVLRRHRDIAVFNEVPAEDQILDAANIHEIAAILFEYGYELVKE